VSSAPTNSLLGQLAARRQEIEEAQVLDLAVPRWSDPEIHVLYRPVEFHELRPIFKAFQKNNDDPEGILNNNAAVLAKACVGVYALLDGKRYSLNPDDPSGELTKFDADLGRNLGIAEDRAVSICRALFITDFDLLNHARELADWSGETAEKAVEEIKGE
jgi:hypothetical protein